AVESSEDLAAEYSTSEITSRGKPRVDAAAFGEIVGNDLIPLGGLGQRWGDPDVEALKFAVNAGIDLSDTLEAYGFATYMDNTTTSDFFYRGPVVTPAQPACLGARGTLQVDNGPLVRPADCDGDGELELVSDGLPDPAPQSLIDSIVAGGGDPADYLVAD